MYVSNLHIVCADTCTNTHTHTHTHTHTQTGPQEGPYKTEPKSMEEHPQLKELKSQLIKEKEELKGLWGHLITSCITDKGKSRLYTCVCLCTMYRYMYIHCIFNVHVRMIQIVLCMCTCTVYYVHVCIQCTYIAGCGPVLQILLLLSNGCMHAKNVLFCSS